MVQNPKSDQSGGGSGGGGGRVEPKSGKSVGVVGGRFTVKQGVIAVHENGATFTVFITSLTMEVDAVTHTGLPQEVTVRQH